MKLPNKTYDFIKWFVILFMPAFITFSGVVGSSFNIPHTQEIITVMAAFNTFLGTITRISNTQYIKEMSKDE